jgi:hypothetical protein
MESAETSVETVHWGIALFSDKLYIFLVTALHIKKGVLIDEYR